MYEQNMLQRYVENIAMKIGMRVERLSWALHELDRMTCFLFEETQHNDEAIDKWLNTAKYSVDDDGFFQSQALLEDFRQGKHSQTAVSCSWGKNLRNDPVARFRQFSLRNIGKTLAELHTRLPFAAWIYYQDVSNTAIQFPFIDQRTAIPWNFNWHEYHTFVSVSPRNNPNREIKWTKPSIDYAGEGLIISVSKPVYTGVDKDWFAGLWSIDVPLRKLHADCIGKPLFTDQETFIIDENRQFISHPQIPILIEKKEGSIFREGLDILGDGFSKISIHGLKEKEDTPFDVWNNKEALVVSNSGVPSIGWVVVSAVPKRILIDAVSQRMKTVLRDIQAGEPPDPIPSDGLPSHWQSLVNSLNEMTGSLKRAHIRETHLNAVIGAVRKINQLIVAEKSAATLILNACNILVETRDYRHAWISLGTRRDDLTQLVAAGVDVELERLHCFLFSDEPPHYISEALSRSAIVYTPANDPANRGCPVMEQVPGLDKLTVRLCHDDITYGILSISVQSETVDDEERILIHQLAGDLGIAVHTIAIQKEQERTAEAVFRLNNELEHRVEERTRELQIANEELESFSYSVSHDLRSPLRAISGFSTVLLEDHGGKLDENGIDALKRIVKGTEQMSRLIDELLRLSRVSRAPLKKEAVDLSEMAEEIVESLRRGDPKRNVTVNIQSDLKANGDPSLLHVILQNLLDNAWKFTRETDAARIDWGWDGSIAGGHYFVKDNGVGFSMAYADKLFEAFQRIHSDSRYPGSGIGLAAAARAVHRHGGKIWGESEEGQGALFGFTLEDSRAPR